MGTIPLPVVAIARDLGLEVFETPKLEDNQSGAIQKEGDQYVIYINDRHPATRKRFTIAHEIAHYILHKDKLDQGDIHVDEIAQPFNNGENRVRLLQRAHRVLTAEERVMETEANKLAAEILMPESLFRAAYEKTNSIEEVAKLFGVSQAAAVIQAKILFGEVLF